jgi:hypothetical protein
LFGSSLRAKRSNPPIRLPHYGLLRRFAPRNDGGTQPRRAGLYHLDQSQQRDDANDNNDNARDLLGAAIERQEVDQVKNKDNDDERDESTDKHPKTPPEMTVKTTVLLMIP